MILNNLFAYCKDLVRSILAKFRLSFNHSQNQRFFSCKVNKLKGGLSHPTRVRGLKHLLNWHYTSTKFAPHTGAWIETPVNDAATASREFAPHTGAWIETQAKVQQS